MRTTIALCCATLAALPACSCDTVPANALESCSALQIPPLAVKTDILFVVDDSGSMSEEQANLAANLGAFIDTLAASPVENDFRVGVTNTAVTDFNGSASYPTGTGSGPMAGKPYPAGAILAVTQVVSGGNSVGVPGSYVYDTNTYATTNGWGGHRFLDRGDATLQQDFKANVLVGTWGSGREQPFRAAQLALTDRIADGSNAGFLRSGAKLAIIILSDEDDCSPTTPPPAVTPSNNWCHDPATKNASPALLEPPVDLATFLGGTIQGEQRDTTVGVIAGFDPADLTQPSCKDTSNPWCSNTNCATAYDKGDRFKALYDTYGVARARLGSICDASFENTLVMFAQALMPTSMPLSGEPADWRMLAVKVTRSSGQAIACKVALTGTPEVGTADAVYHPPTGGQPPELTFTNACLLQLGDSIDVQVVCAG